MADIVTELRLYLVADAGVAALIDERIYQDTIPQGMNTQPAIVLDEISGVDDQAIDASITLRTTRVRARCYGATPSAAAAVRRAIADAAGPIRGEIGDDDLFVNCVELVARGNGVDPPIDGSDTFRPYKFQDFLITHR